jgi:transmembrane sensor
MEDSNYQWSTLLRKYRRQEINEEELKELQRLINSCPFKMWQFKQWTDPQEFAKRLQRYNSIKTEGAWERLVAAYPSVVTPDRIPFLKQPAVRRFILESLAIAGVVAIVYLSITLSNKDPDQLTAAILQPVIMDYSYVKDISGNEYNLATSGKGTILESKGAKLVYRDTILEIANDGKMHSNNKVLMDLVTAPRQQMQLRFSDGSLIKLSSASAVRFPLQFASSERRVQLSGQAFFNVVKNKPVPFKVRLMNGVEAEATGTTFNITSYDNGTIVLSLISGTINMIYGKIKVPVHPGQQIEFTQEKKFRFIENPNFEQATAWTRNEFDFYNKDIKDVIREIGRFYHYDVKYKDSLPPMPASGTFDTKNNLHEILSAIATLNKVDIQPEGNTLIVSRQR